MGSSAEADQAFAAGKQHPGKRTTMPDNTSSKSADLSALGIDDRARSAGSGRRKKSLLAAAVVIVLATVAMLVTRTGPPDMFLCGNDETARTQVAAICRDLGWGVIDMGGTAAARLIEPLALIYILTAIRTGSWDYAFKLMKA
jgi:hypothetical protein